MKTYSSEEIEAKLRKHTGFFRGIKLSLLLAWRFLVSLGPQNWDIVKISNAGRIDPLESSSKTASNEVSVAPIEPDRSAP